MAARAHSSRTGGESLSQDTVWWQETGEYQRGRSPKRENQGLALPESGWEREAAGPVGSKTPTEDSPAPGQTLYRNPLETPPAGAKDGR